MFAQKYNNHRNALRAARAKKQSLNVVITGGTRGLGRAFAEEFVRYGDKVYVLARKQQDLENLQKITPEIQGICCDVGNREQLQSAVSCITSKDEIDVWINNAGVSGGSRTLLELTDDKIDDIFKTNLLGTCNSCKIVYDVMVYQPCGGAIFNLAGAGSDGNATAQYSVYGATKAGIVQLTKSLQKEWKETNVDLHVISPGMMLTDLLTENIPMDTFKVIEFICSHPELVSLHLVPRIRRAYYKDETSYIRFLTILRILGKVVKSIR